MVFFKNKKFPMLPGEYHEKKKANFWVLLFSVKPTSFLHFARHPLITPENDYLFSKYF